MTSRLKEFRTKARISQNALARKCEIHPSQVCLIEGGARTSKSTAAKLARALNVDPTEICPDFTELREA